MLFYNSYGVNNLHRILITYPTSNVFTKINQIYAMDIRSFSELAVQMYQLMLKVLTSIKYCL